MEDWRRGGGRGWDGDGFGLQEGLVAGLGRGEVVGSFGQGVQSLCCSVAASVWWVCCSALMWEHTWASYIKRCVLCDGMGRLDKRGGGHRSPRHAWRGAVCGGGGHVVTRQVWSAHARI